MFMYIAGVEKRVVDFEQLVGRFNHHVFLAVLFGRVEKRIAIGAQVHERAIVTYFIYYVINA